MQWIRARLTRCVAIWLLCQCCTMAWGQTALYASGSSIVRAGCTCSHRHGICPMHHRRGASVQHQSADNCECHGTSDPLGAVVASLIGPSADLPPVASAFVPVFRPVTAMRSDGLLLDFSRVPDPPPPRA